MDWQSEQTTLEKILAKYYPSLIGRAFSDGESDLGRPIRFDAHGADAIMADIGARAAGITGTLRDTIAEVVNKWGDNYPAAVRELQERAGLTAAKAEEIARSEAATAYNRGTALAARSAGLTRVYVFDGNSDQECASVADTYQTLEWAEANPLSHPNCQRRFSLVEEAA